MLLKFFKTKEVFLGKMFWPLFDARFRAERQEQMIISNFLRGKATFLKM
jgi:hypothetical protein